MIENYENDCTCIDPSSFCYLEKTIDFNSTYFDTYDEALLHIQWFCYFQIMVKIPEGWI